MTAYCHDERHDTPCPLPCPACEAECQVELINDHHIRKVDLAISKMDAAIDRAKDEWK